MKNNLTFALAQINPTVGDIAGNRAKILEAYAQAKTQGADLVICPELCVIGYPPEDLVLTPSFRKDAMQAIRQLAEQTVGGPALVVGCVWEENAKVYNAGLLLDNGNLAHVTPKTMLPNYGVFDEKRLFSAGDGGGVVTWRGVKLGLLVCEDMWFPEVPLALAKQGAELLIVINASPFEAGKLVHRHDVAKETVSKAKVPLIYVNTVGGQDDLVFDGGSFAMSAEGRVVVQMPECVEGVEVIAGSLLQSSPVVHPPLPLEDSLWQAMTLGLRDYVHKNGFKGVVLGLSGGIDSALSAAVAVDALGPQHVTGVLLSSPYTSKASVEDALHSAKLLGIETMNIPITPGMSVLEEVLNPVFKEAGWMENVVLGGNVQARLRGLMLMSLSNRFGWLLLSTGNKSEIAVGYSTLYGDSCGGFNVLKDVYKMQVYKLANWRNSVERNGRGEVIPQRSIDKAPSAELAPGQTDQDQLPPYDVLDQILTHHLEGRLGAQEIIARGFTPEVVEKVLKLVRINEYKRRQSCPGVKVSTMMFGRERRYPLTNKY